MPPDRSDPTDFGRLSPDAIAEKAERAKGFAERPFSGFFEDGPQGQLFPPGTAQHVDEMEPGSLTQPQWEARADVKYHAGHEPTWSRDYEDMAVHTGDATTAQHRGGAYMHRLRIPQMSSHELLRDTEANSVHAAWNMDEGRPVSDSVQESLPGESEPVGYGDKWDGDVATVDHMDAIRSGETLGYLNSGEVPFGTKPKDYPVSFLSPQASVRTWAGDVQELSRRSPESVPANVLSRSQFVGDRATPQSYDPPPVGGWEHRQSNPPLPHPDSSPDASTVHNDVSRWRDTGEGRG